MQWIGAGSTAVYKTPMEEKIFDLQDLKPGWVWLAGAGPGDPGLLTLYCLRALQQADAVVYDALVGADVLKLARQDCLLIYAGKRGGKPSAQQPDISARLIALAREGKRVLRLKGGDPFVFGRGGEEALALREAGIPFRIVPGVTAGIAGLAYAGIPLTHRDTNHAATFLTGHNAMGVVPDSVDWRALATGAPVIVMYMAMKHIEAICNRLMRAGRRADEKLAFISSATTADQRVVVTTLGEAAETVRREGVGPPAIVVLGAVVGLHEDLDWLPAALADMEGR